MTYELKIYQYNATTKQLEHTNTITSDDNNKAVKELAKIFVDKHIRGTKTKITSTYNNELKITQTWLGATNFETIEPSDYKITHKYEYTFYDCNL